jgi:hypothetical protein
VGLRKKLLGVGEFNFEVLYVTGLTIRENQMNAQASHVEYGEYWELWEWMVFWQFNQGSITEDEFGRLYLLLGLAVKDFEYEYQRDDQVLWQRFGMLYADLQSVFRPHLAVAFLPPGHGSEIWPLTGKPVRGVKLREGFGSTLPGQLLQKIENDGFKIDLTSPQMTTIYIIAGAFVHCLKMSNEKGRAERIGIRQSAFEILPFFICFDLFKSKQKGA